MGGMTRGTGVKENKSRNSGLSRRQEKNRQEKKAINRRKK